MCRVWRERYSISAPVQQTKLPGVRTAVLRSHATPTCPCACQYYLDPGHTVKRSRCLLPAANYGERGGMSTRCRERRWSSLAAGNRVHTNTALSRRLLIAAHTGAGTRYQTTAKEQDTPHSGDTKSTPTQRDKGHSVPDQQQTTINISKTLDQFRCNVSRITVNESSELIPLVAYSLTERGIPSRPPDKLDSAGLPGCYQSATMEVSYWLLSRWRFLNLF